ncbi:uncharacterized protein BT62DRAFT_1008542 [Guyanagaster necrorhizus]|uniref:Uncharacterized protein n=1 Tax=Guyanagaster necrorhizus TaxID=856835 RepID=A0A9P7VP22_9AGAR|nr:uncharacterized protein BT62DRAFT_1008542 [Guyanagaster necrorhizus MCA 3950]KAG7443865.1 hypothetical protein BT62DRAFT_1008542 [Guyanagaster necrorhizus MCA 3950]
MCIAHQFCDRIYEAQKETKDAAYPWIEISAGTPKATAISGCLSILLVEGCGNGGSFQWQNMRSPGSSLPPANAGHRSRLMIHTIFVTPTLLHKDPASVCAGVVHGSNGSLASNGGCHKVKIDHLNGESRSPPLPTTHSAIHGMSSASRIQDSNVHLRLYTGSKAIPRKAIDDVRVHCRPSLSSEIIRLDITVRGFRHRRRSDRPRCRDGHAGINAKPLEKSRRRRMVYVMTDFGLMSLSGFVRKAYSPPADVRSDR